MKYLALILAVIGTTAWADVPEPAGFHGEPYRSEVPATLSGATVIDGAAALALSAKGVPFVDVLPQVKRPEGLPEGTLWRAPAHQTIPGAVWLSNTGYDRLSDAENKRLIDGLATATKGDKAAPVVLFCKRDCWMSWNAAKRAVQAGYSNVIWFPGGVEDWLEAGGTPLVNVTAAP